MDIGSGKGDPYDYIDKAVRKFKYPGVIDTLEATDIKERFAQALETFAAAYLKDIPEIRLQASSNLDEVSNQLRARCTSLGHKFVEN